MSNPGFIYALINPAITGLLKIGKTTRDPDQRIDELSLPTGIPSRFILVHKVAVTDCDLAERLVHSELERFRESPDREFFRISVREAILTIDKICLAFRASESQAGGFDQADPGGLTPLMRACLNNDSEAVRVLLAKGADPNVRTSDGTTALSMAAAKGHAVVVDFLLFGGADLDSKMPDGTTALSAAQTRGRTYVIQMLVNYQKRKEEGHTLSDRSSLEPEPNCHELRAACESNDIRAVHRMLAKYCDPNESSEDGFTPLMLAARKGHSEIVALLLQYGAHEESKSSSGATAQEIAEAHGHFATANQILNHCLSKRRPS